MDIEKTVVKFTDEMDVGTICDTLRIQDTKTKFNRIRSIKTCRPKIENGIIHLFLKSAEPGCHVEVVNAEIKYPEIPTTTPP
uniref:Uncharacterized protein n=1 Tax=Panagrolaimus superbus TaxID=310955 RepID=A0A914ZAM2_9BILA